MHYFSLCLSPISHSKTSKVWNQSTEKLRFNRYNFNKYDSDLALRISRLTQHELILTKISKSSSPIMFNLSHLKENLDINVFEFY